MANDVNETLATRETTYGDFTDVALLSQMLKVSFQQFDGYERLLPYQKEALDMICSKLARIVNGDPNYKDSWHDIAGYAKLVEDRL